jgi:hypothetical protein
MAPAVALLLPASLAAAPGGLGVSVGLVVLGLSLGIMGALNGPLDIALFTVRQRRTETAWMGRAFAVSMAFNFVGFPVGAALAGIVAESSVEAAVVVAVVACVIAATLAATMIPKSDERTA